MVGKFKMFRVASKVENTYQVFARPFSDFSYILQFEMMQEFENVWCYIECKEKNKRSNESRKNKRKNERRMKERTTEDRNNERKNKWKIIKEEWKKNTEKKNEWKNNERRRIKEIMKEEK